MKKKLKYIIPLAIILVVSIWCVNLCIGSLVSKVYRYEAVFTIEDLIGGLVVSALIAQAALFLLICIIKERKLNYIIILAVILFISVQLVATGINGLFLGNDDIKNAWTIPGLITAFVISALAAQLSLFLLIRAIYTIYKKKKQPPAKIQSTRM